MSNNTSTLHHHLTEVKEGKRRFENAFQGVSRMILESQIEKILSGGIGRGRVPEYWDGKTASRVVKSIEKLILL